MEVFFSVIMPVYLGDYEGAAKGRAEKFKRAVKSFLANIYNESELIIVSDGCDESENIYNTLFSKYKQIKFYKIPKQPLFSGNVRQYGLQKSTGKYIAYLDSDDVIGDWHLYKIHQGLKRFNYPEWVYFDDFIVYSLSNIYRKKVSLNHGSIGTSSI
jgi:glycosyltransferase involved in cell wall biosynthesis